MINFIDHLIDYLLIMQFPYLEASQAVWPGRWEWVLGLLDGYQKWAEGPLDELLGWVWVLQGEKVEDETEEAY